MPVAPQASTGVAGGVEPDMFVGCVARSKLSVVRQNLQGYKVCAARAGMNERVLLPTGAQDEAKLNDVTHSYATGVSWL